MKSCLFVRREHNRGNINIVVHGNAYFNGSRGGGREVIHCVSIAVSAAHCERPLDETRLSCDSVCVNSSGIDASSMRSHVLLLHVPVDVNASKKTGIRNSCAVHKRKNSNYCVTSTIMGRARGLLY